MGLRFAELVVIGLILLLLLGGSWLGGAGKSAGKSARKKYLEAKWIWTSVAGTEAEAQSAESELGRECARRILEQAGATDVGPGRQLRIESIAARLSEPLAGRGRFSCHVIAGQELNAFALPGGYLFLYDGLCATLRDDADALAFVLAHEMAHVLLGHPRERLKREILVHGLTPRTAGIGELLKALVIRGYSRDDELEADRRAVTLAEVAGFRRSGAVQVLEMFRRQGAEAPRVLSYLGSHPPVKERLKNLESMA
jgi:predicted Zn-dependent protease